MGTQFTAMILVQQQLVTAHWYHQSSSFTLAPKHEFKSMPCPYAEYSICAICPTCNLLYLNIRRLPCAFMNMCQKSVFNLQVEYLPLLRVAVCDLTNPFTTLARQGMHNLSPG